MKVAIFGVWHVHAKDYAKHAIEHAEVLGFYERDDKLAENFLEMFGFHRYSTAEELLSSDAEGVIVCSATSDHAEDMIRIANAGKHIFTEKVLALTVADCLRVEEAVKKNGVGFTISLFQKYLAPRRAVKAVVDSGELGKINYMRFRNCHAGSARGWLPSHFYNREQCGGGAMIDLGAHGMYLINWILGMPHSAKSSFTVACREGDAAEKNTDGVEDNAVTVMTFADGTIAVNETGFLSSPSQLILEVSGDRGWVRMTGNDVVKCTADTELLPVAVEIGESLPPPIVQFLTGNVLDGCSIEEAKALTRMMEMAYGE